jgi:hypothetical protein
MNMIDSDKIVQLNQKIEFTDISLLSKIRHVKGGPDSVVMTRNAEFYPNKKAVVDPYMMMLKGGRPGTGRSLSPRRPRSRSRSPSPNGHPHPNPNRKPASDKLSSTDKSSSSKGGAEGATAAAVGGVVNDGGVHTWLDVIRTIRQVGRQTDRAMG